ncbi:MULTISPECIES: CsbD family protein [Streptomycetaceae]|uniref:CsbD family protein n=1 Tax=Kitasatospora arboriphila TaxID=258052 RepID=A0ABP4ENK4_9ACTN|nr:CsbD family protein [Streptomyces sp. NRRL B-24484]
MSGKNKVENMAQKAKGKATETAGKAVGNERMTAKGKIDQAAADAKQAGEKAKDALKH